MLGEISGATESQKLLAAQQVDRLQRKLFSGGGGGADPRDSITTS
jgi:hypothetical protein